MTEVYRELGQLNDGPYVFKNSDQWLIRWVENGISKKIQLSKKELSAFLSRDIRFFDPSYLLSYAHDARDVEWQYNDVSRIVILSDIHGQYEQLIKLLKSHEIVNNDLNWNFDSGHLVILGDVLDRGDQVQECLWLLFKLEQQATHAGGKFHYVLGNHEVMILLGDLRYMNKKYEQIAHSLGMTYDRLFSRDSILGSWLRTKPAVIGINDILFVHAGISPDLVKAGFTLDEINQEFKKLLTEKQSGRRVFTESRLQLLHGTKGPVWYRGHIYDPDFSTVKLNEILNYYGKKFIVAGHTTMPKIEPSLENKMYVVDSGIKYGDRGEIMIVENGKFYAGDDLGRRRPL